MTRFYSWALLTLGMVGLATGVGHMSALAAPPNKLKCDGNSPLQCYCKTDGTAPNQTSCYATGGPFYVCVSGGTTDNCDTNFKAVNCGGGAGLPITGDLYNGPCNPTGGPTPGVQPIGKCSYPQASCQ